MSTGASFRAGCRFRRGDALGGVGLAAAGMTRRGAMSPGPATPRVLSGWWPANFYGICSASQRSRGTARRHRRIGRTVDRSPAAIPPRIRPLTFGDLGGDDPGRGVTLDDDDELTQGRPMRVPSTIRQQGLRASIIRSREMRRLFPERMSNGIQHAAQAGRRSFRPILMRCPRRAISAG